LNKLRLGLALTGSYCSFGKLQRVLPALAEAFDILPIFSESALLDSRFGEGAAWRAVLEECTGRKAVATIGEAEPLGPGGLLDVLAIIPCTGNTLGKLAGGVTDSAVTMAAKGHLRNGKPLVLGVSTNDGLAGAFQNIGRLMNVKNVYFVPFGQDDPLHKPTSLQADFTLLESTVESAKNGRQLQPVLLT
jgi:dipicolinate synthase subunit B